VPYSRLYYHFVWATKDRLPLITTGNRELILKCIAAKVNELNGILHALSAMEDHIHLVATVPPSVSLSNFIAQVKGGASHLANHSEGADSQPFNWQTEYGVLSVSESHLPAVVRYVQDQERHHAQNRLDRKLESI